MGAGRGSKCRDVMNSYNNQYDSVQNWLDFIYCSQAIRRLLMDGQKRPGAAVSSRHVVLYDGLH